MHELIGSVRCFLPVLITRYGRVKSSFPPVIWLYSHLDEIDVVIGGQQWRITYLLLVSLVIPIHIECIELMRFLCDVDGVVINDPGEINNTPFILFLAIQVDVLVYFSTKKIPKFDRSLPKRELKVKFCSGNWTNKIFGIPRTAVCVNNRRYS